MAVRWRFILLARDTDTGLTRRWLDYTPDNTVVPPRGGLSLAYAVFLANEWITALNGELPRSDPIVGSELPYLGICRYCGRVVDDQHLLGGERDVCDGCWTAPPPAAGG